MNYRIGGIYLKKVRIVFAFALLIIIVTIVTKTYFFHPKVYPFKSQFFAWAGDTKFIEFSSRTITEAELKKMKTLIRPGDIFLNRSDYYISNIGIPGFWTHAGLYVGTPNERKKMFGSDHDCIDWIRLKGENTGNLEALLRNKYNSIYESQHTDQNYLSIIESVSEGVIMSSFESGARKEGIVILRPKIAKREIVEAIYKAFAYVSKPYDYNFDFSTDTVIACTELVYKVYEDNVLFPVNDMFGKPFSTANEIAEYCDKNYNNPQLKLSLVYIYDGEIAYTAENDTAHIIFRKSWNQSLW